jgi:hypothetical protein
VLIKEHLGDAFTVDAAWQDGLAAELDELVTPAWYDVIGLAGAIMGLARADVDLDPSSGAHADASGLTDLVATLLSYQVPGTGGFSWESDMHGDLDTTTQETAYAVLALVEARDFGIDGLDAAIADAQVWLVATQIHAGGWFTYQGGDEYSEVDGEALWAIVAAGL